MFRLSTCSSRTTLIYKQGITTRLLTVHSFSGHSKNQSCKNVNSSIFLSFLCFNPSNLKQPDASLISGIPSAVTETWTTWMLLKQWTAGIPGPSIHWKVTHPHTYAAEDSGNDQARYNDASSSSTLNLMAQKHGRGICPHYKHFHFFINWLKSVAKATLFC